jgi:hypothetical protein
MSAAKQRGYYGLDLGPGWVWVLIGIFALVGMGWFVWTVLSWLIDHVRFV